MIPRQLLARHYLGGAIILSLVLVFWLKARYFLAGTMPFIIISVSFTVFLILEFALATFSYHPVGDQHYFPRLSLIMPAYNEGKVIYETASAAAKSSYTREGLEIIVVNDGSTDNTKEELAKAEKEFQIRAVNLAENTGKRKAVAEGFKLSKGDIVAIMDSDTFLDPGALYNGVQYFSDSRVGAVCGHGKVYNKAENTLTKMQDAWYDGMFEVFKGAESVFGMVTCCSGLLSFYRRTSIESMMESWATETFMGVLVRSGEDRALTNIVLKPRTKYLGEPDDHMMTNMVAKRGESVVYASNALAYTIVPNTLTKFLKQQVRWKRGWFRGNVIALTFMWRKHPVGSLMYYLHTVLAYITPAIVARMLLAPVIDAAYLPPFIYITGLLYVGLLYAVYFAVRERGRTWPYRILFQVTYNLLISPFLSLLAWITIRRESWMTR